MLITHEIAIIIILVVPPDCTIVVAKNPQEHAPVAKRPPPGHIHTETEKRGHPVAPPVVERRHSCQPVIPANSRIHRGSPEGGTSAVNGQREARVLWPPAVAARLFRACLVRMRVRVGSGVFWDGMACARRHPAYSGAVYPCLASGGDPRFEGSSGGEEDRLGV